MPGLATDEKRSCYECTLGLVAKVSISLPTHYKTAAYSNSELSL